MIKKTLFIVIGIFAPLLAAQAAETPGKHLLNPLGDVAGPQELYGRLLRFMLGFVGVGALAFFIIGGVILLMSRGNPDKVKAGKDTIVWAIIGMFVAFASYVLLRFVLEIIITPTGA
ncbi:MAG: hypothetical protein U1C18_00170 [Patescibacteria group bacterium]|nr:hypothetical protein [Patescibacteria group bacterium]